MVFISFIISLNGGSLIPVVWERHSPIVIPPLPCVERTGSHVPTVSDTRSLPSSTKVITTAALYHLLELATITWLFSVYAVRSSSNPCFLATYFTTVFCRRLISSTDLLYTILPSL